MLQLRLMLALVLAAVAAWAASHARLESGLMALLPEGSEDAAHIAQLEAVGAFDRLVVEVDRSDGQRLSASVQALAESLRASPVVADVVAGVEPGDVEGVKALLTDIGPLQLPESTVRERLSDEGLRASLREYARMMASPLGLALGGAARAKDPLGLGAEASVRLLSGPANLRVRSEGGILRSEDGEHALLVVFPVEPTPGPNALAHAMDDIVDAAPSPARWFGGARVASETESAVRQDGFRVGVMGLLALSVVVLLGFRSVRPVLGALVPVGTAMLGMGAAMAWYGPVHSISLGLSGGLAGLAIDYWLHVYVHAAAEGKKGDRLERMAAAGGALRRIRVPLLLGALSSLGALGLLTLSDLPVVAQLGTLGVGAISGALVGVMLAGPWLFGWVGASHIPGPSLVIPNALRWGVIGTTALLFVGAMQVQFNGDPRALAPAPADVLELQDAFEARYGGQGESAFVVAEGLDSASRVLEALRGIEGITVHGAPASMVSAQEQSRIREHLTDPTLDARFVAAAADVGLDGEGMLPALHDSLERTGPSSQDLFDSPLGPALRRSMPQGPEGAVLLNVVVEDAAMREALAPAVAQAASDAVVFMPRRMGKGVTEAVVQELAWLALLALGVVLLGATLWYRQLGPVLGAVLPAVMGLVGGLGAMGLLGRDLDSVGASGLVLVLGLGVDYGVFATDGALRGSSAPARRAIVLSAATSLATLGVLTFAATPALSGLGVVLTSGLVMAFAGAMTLSAPLALGETMPPRLRVALRWASVTVLVLLNVAGWIWARFQVAPPEVEPRDVTAQVEHVLGLQVLRLKGSPYAMGLAHGRATADKRLVLEEDLRRRFAEAVPSRIARGAILGGVFTLGAGLDEHVRLRDLQELRGLAESAPDSYPWSIPLFTRALYFHGLHDIGQSLVDSPLMGCTGLLASGQATADGHTLLLRNLDFEGGAAFDRDKVVVARQPDEGLATVSVAFSGMVGVVSGMNEAGIALALQAAGDDTGIRVGTPMTLVLREALEEADSLDGVQAVLERRTGMVAELVLAADGKTGEIAVFEVSPGVVERYSEGDTLAVSNHFRTPALAASVENERRMLEQTTVPRLARMEALGAVHRTLLDVPLAIDILRDRRGPAGEELPKAHRWAINADIAAHGVVFDATARSVTVSTWPHTSGRWVTLSWDELMGGDLQGEVAAKAAGVSDALRTDYGRRMLQLAKGARGEARVELLEEAVGAMPGHPEPAIGLATSDPSPERVEAAVGAVAEHGRQRAAQDALGGAP